MPFRCAQKYSNSTDFPIILQKFIEDRYRLHRIGIILHGGIKKAHDNDERKIPSQLIHPGEDMLQPENDRVLKTQEVCEYLKISRPTFKQYISLGRIQATRAGHGWRVTKSGMDKGGKWSETLSVISYE